MGKGDYTLTKEEEEFLDASKSSGQGKKMDYVKAVRHAWGRDGESTSHLVYIACIPKDNSGSFNGLYIPPPKIQKIHSFIGPMKGSKTGGLFPHTRQYSIQCTGDDKCLVCKRLKPWWDKFNEAKADGNEELANKISKNALAAKARKVVGFIGVALYKKKEETGFERVLEMFQISDFFWQKSFANFMQERATPFAEYCEEHADEPEFAGLSEDAIKEKWLKECPAKYPLFWHPRKGFVVNVQKSGKGINQNWAVTKDKDFPILPFKIPEELSDEKKLKMEKLLKQAKANHAFLLECQKNNLIPDLNYFYGPITVEDQYRVLGVDKEEAPGDDDGEVVDSENSEEKSPPKKPKKPAKEDSDTDDEDVKEVKSSDDDDLDLDDDEDEKKPAKKSEKKAAQKDDDDELTSDDEEEKPKPSKKPAKAEESDDDEDEAPKKSKTDKPKKKAKSDDLDEELNSESDDDDSGDDDIPF